jgi:hypothetical protein
VDTIDLRMPLPLLASATHPHRIAEGFPILEDQIKTALGCSDHYCPNRLLAAIGYDLTREGRLSA